MAWSPNVALSPIGRCWFTDKLLSSQPGYRLSTAGDFPQGYSRSPRRITIRTVECVVIGDPRASALHHKQRQGVAALPVLTPISPYRPTQGTWLLLPRSGYSLLTLPAGLDLLWRIAFSPGIVNSMHQSEFYAHEGRRSSFFVIPWST